MTTLEFTKITHEYACEHATNDGEKNIVVNFGYYLITRYQKELFEETDTIEILKSIFSGWQSPNSKENQNGNIYPPIEKESLADDIASRIKKKDSVYSMNAAYHFPKDFNESKAYADSYMIRVKRFNHHVSDDRMKIADYYIHEFAKTLLHCYAQSENELQDFVNVYYDRIRINEYNDDAIEPLVYALLSDFARYVLL